MSDVRENLANPLPLLALLLVAAGLVAQYPPLASVRPQDSERLQPPPSLEVPSRLWQDPLAAVEAHQRARKPGSEEYVPTPDIESLSAELEEKLGLHPHSGEAAPRAANASPPELLILPVMMVASPFPDDAEHRRRLRYAVESALAAQGFAPDDAEALRYVRWKPSRRNCGSAKRTDTPPVVGAACNAYSTLPYEWFRRERHASAHDGARGADQPTIALVLWLREHEFMPEPKMAVERLVRELMPRESMSPPGAPPHVGVIGPATSTQYLALLREIDASEPTRTQPAAPREPDEREAGRSSSAPVRTQPAAPREPDEREAGRSLSAPARTRPAEPPKPEEQEASRSPSATPARSARSEVSALRVAMSDVREQSAPLSDVREQSPALSDVREQGPALSDVREQGSASSGVRAQSGPSPHGALFTAAREPAGAALSSAATARTSEQAHVNAVGLRRIDGEERASTHAPRLPIRFLSYGATISEDEAVAAVRGRHESNARPPESVVRVIKGDDLLVDALVRELGRRGVNRAAFAGRDESKASCREAIALVVEGDYAYGRSLRRAFEREARKRCADVEIHAFTYFRGLDGVLPATGEREESRGQRANDGKGKEASTADAPRENAEGRNQFDYLRRIADQIAQLDAESGSRRPLRAVGIFGSDVYDKLLILQALQPRLKSAIPFTTDLDARFLQRDQASWARNLVVASHYGLALHRNLQGETPPFRDGYQTAAYLAAFTAAYPDADGAARRVAKIESPPRLFEIGRTRAVELASSGNARPCPGLLDCESFHPAPALEIPRVASWRVWLAAMLGAMLVLVTTRANRVVVLGVQLMQQRKEERRPIVRAIIAWSLGAIAVALMLALVALFVTGEIEAGDGEPFVWLEGVSAWPSHLIRFLALIVAIVLGALARRRLRLHAGSIARDFHLPKPEADKAGRVWAARPGRDAPARARLTWRRWIEWLRGPFDDFARTQRETDGRADGRVVVDRLWLRYLARTGSAPFWWWVAFATLLLAAFAYALYTIDPAFFGHRGKWVMRVNELLWVGNVVVLWGTIFWTVFEARACACFIERLSSTPSAWPAETLARESERTGVPRACLVPELDFRLILRTAERIGPIVYIPFVQIFLLGIAFHPFFDTVDIPWPLIALAAISLAYAIYAMIRLRRAAERARKAIIDAYNAALLWLQGNGKAPAAKSQWQAPGVELQEQVVRDDLRRDEFLPEPQGFAQEVPGGQCPTYTPLRLEEIAPERRADASAQVKALIATINAQREGPFLPLLQQPAVKALLIPFGGWGGLSLIEPLLNYYGL